MKILKFPGLLLRHFSFAVLPALCFMFLNPLVIYSETIQLKSGKSLEGTVLEKTDEYLKLDTGEQVMKVPLRMLQGDQDSYMQRNESFRGYIETLDALDEEEGILAANEEFTAEEGEEKDLSTSYVDESYVDTDNEYIRPDEGLSNYSDDIKSDEEALTPSDEDYGEFSEEDTKQAKKDNNPTKLVNENIKVRKVDENFDPSQMGETYMVIYDEDGKPSEVYTPGY